MNALVPMLLDLTDATGSSADLVKVKITRLEGCVMTRWAMVADLERCVGCQTCTAACRHANATSPAVQWRKVLDIEAGSFPNVNRTFVPVGCQHCADPPCMHVCPTTATRQRADGIVTIDYDICIGCAYCDVACPYQARFKITKEDFAYGAEAMQNEIEREISERLGVAQKCTFCSDRIDFGIENDLHAGQRSARDAGLRQFLHRRRAAFRRCRRPRQQRLQAAAAAQEFQHACRTRHRAGLPLSLRQGGGRDRAGCAARGFGSAGRAHSHARGRALASEALGLEGVGNFLCGGAGTGLFAFTTIAGLNGTRDLVPGLAALALIACGLTLLMFKIGRPLRFIYVLRQPQRSWMSREAWVAGLLFPLALFALWFDQPMVLLAAAMVGLLFLFCQGMILEQSKGIPAWRNPRVIALIMATGLAEGCGLFLLLAAVLPDLGARRQADGHRAGRLGRDAVLDLAALFRRAGKRRRADPHAGNLHGLPRLVLCRRPGAAGRAGRRRPDARPCAGAALFALAGLSVFATGWAIKFILITRAAYNQGFALPHTPVRGSGAAGTGGQAGMDLAVDNPTRSIEFRRGE